MKKMKLATKICLITIVALAIGLVLVWRITDSQVSESMKKTVIQKMDDSVATRLEIVLGYVDKAEAYLSAYAQEPSLKEFLHDQGNADLAARVQEYTKAYASVNADLENVYLASYGSTVLASFVEPVIGVTLRSGDALKELQGQVFATKGIYNIGIMASPSTGNQVVSLYYPIYDGNEKIGYAGGAIYAESLRNTLNSLSGDDETGVSYMLVDTNAKTYIFCENDELIGTVIEDEKVLNIIDAAVAVESGISTYEKGNTLAVTDYVADRNWVFLALTDTDVAFASVSKLSMVLALICLSVLVIVSVIIFIAVKLISKDLTKVGNIISDIGTLNLTSKDKLEGYLKRGDEVGIIANATNHLAESISNVIINLKKESQDLYDTSQAMLDNSKVTIDSIKGVEKAIQEIAGGANEQASETQKASASVVHIGGMIEASTGKSAELNDIAANIQTASGEVVETLKILIDINEKAKDAIEEINKQTNSTNESVLRIKDAAELITSIAEETNLLSLNASIEAARAGEQGRGFAVVANQIQKLAEQSNKSAQQIDQIISVLIADSSQAVNIMNDVKVIMEEKSKHLISTEKQFDEVNKGIDETRMGVVTINGTIDDMDKERINVVDVVQNLTAIAEENAASTEETLASTEIVSNMMDEMSNIAIKLSEISSEIEKSIDDFII